MKYTEENLKEYIGKIAGLDRAAMEQARRRQAQLAKPPGSLGKLEELSVQLAGITGKIQNHIGKKRLLIFAADNGVVAEGVSSAPQEVTLSQSVNLTRGKTGAAVLANHFGCELIVCDVGINANSGETAILDRKIACGTNNIAHGAAMTREAAVQAVMTGIELTAAAADEGVDVIGIGEMGIGNTTTSSAVLTALTGAPVETVTGRGGGITDAGYEKKLEVIRRALQINQPDKNDPLDVLSKVGGFDLTAMTGAFIGGAAARVPAVIDGLISAAAALCAVRLCPAVRDFLIPSHASSEAGYAVAAGALGIEPLFTLGMRLGEGSGCPLAFEVLGAACAVMNKMATFEEAGIDDRYLDEIRTSGALCKKGER